MAAADPYLTSSRQYFFLIFWLSLILFLGYEIYWAKKRNLKIYDSRDSLANIVLYLGIYGMEIWAVGYSYWILRFFYQFRVFSIPKSYLAVFAVIVAGDFVHYWMHRAIHYFRFLWALHVTHHSSQNLNLSTGFRNNWLGHFLRPLFYIPLALIGFPPLYILFSLVFVFLFQSWCHTQAIGKIKFLDGIINTPSDHRVHHAYNAIYIDKNFGAVFMIWDRIFGTYRPETEVPKYGITTRFKSYNPVTISIHGLVDLFKGKLIYRG